MTRSLANGDYSLVMAIESASRPDSWYRVLADRQTGALSCDCPPWTFKQGQDAGASTERSCPHTRFAGQLALRTPLPGVQARRSGEALSGVVPSDLLAATQQQWPGLRGHWSIDGRVAEVNEKPYQLILLGLEMGNGGSATGVAAFAERHHPTLPRLQAGVAGWCGYAIAAEVARRGGFPLAGQPPEHFRVTASRGRATGRSPQEPRPREGRPSGAPVVPRLGLRDILRIGDQVNLGDGLVPIQRAENTLRLFLGEGLYGQLEVQRFLDVSSVR